MVDRHALMEKAMDRTRNNPAFITFAQKCAGGSNAGKNASQNRSLFSKLTAILKAAKNDDILSHREVLEAVRQWKDDCFEGVNTANLQELIDLLFRYGVLTLADTAKGNGFAGYTRADLLAYVEICRRYFWVAQELPKQELSRQAVVQDAAPKTPPIETEGVSATSP
ncbi:MAG: hypothetical protein LBU67_01785 [Oscillospiraceae bacterium]|jgi:hypothetical protein|nr:hypothetical protein [Oscillospiraceae bacterium]